MANVESRCAFAHFLVQFRQRPQALLDLPITDNPIPLAPSFDYVCDCSTAINVSPKSTLLITGNLCSTIRMEPNSELVILGDVLTNGRILVHRDASIYIGGNVLGEIIGHGILRVWVSGSFCGDLKTGSPSTEIDIAGDMKGVIRPALRPSLLWMKVGGYASLQSLHDIIGHGYQLFHASIDSSDCPHHIIPTEEENQMLEAKRMFSRCTILRPGSLQSRNEGPDESGMQR